MQAGSLESMKEELLVVIAKSNSSFLSALQVLDLLVNSEQGAAELTITHRKLGQIV